MAASSSVRAGSIPPITSTTRSTSSRVTSASRVGGEQVRRDVGVVGGPADGDPGHLDRPADAGGQVVGLLGDQAQHLAADGAAAQQRDLQRLAS